MHTLLRQPIGWKSSLPQACSSSLMFHPQSEIAVASDETAKFPGNTTRNLVWSTVSKYGSNLVDNFLSPNVSAEYY